MVAERLTGIYVGYMHFHNRGGNRRNGIGNGQRCMGISSRVKNDAVGGKAHLVDFVDNCTFMVTLKIRQAQPGIRSPERLKVCGKLQVTVDAFFPNAQQVEVGSVNDYNIAHMETNLANNPTDSKRLVPARAPACNKLPQN